MADDVRAAPPSDTETRGIRELYAEDPVAADRRLFGRIAHPDRRGFLGGAGLAAMGAALGMTIPFHRNMPSGLIPAAFAQNMNEGDLLLEKDGLVVLNDRPINAETPAHLLDDDITPGQPVFRAQQRAGAGRSHGGGCRRLDLDRGMARSTRRWKLTLDQLRNDFDTVTLALQLECGGNGRAFFQPGASGNQWTFGAIGNAEWTGVRMRDLLQAAGMRDTAVYTGHVGADPHVSGDPERLSLSRGVPIAKGNGRAYAGGVCHERA